MQMIETQRAQKALAQVAPFASTRAATAFIGDDANDHRNPTELQEL